MGSAKQRGVMMKLAPSWLADVQAERDRREWNNAELTRRCGFAADSTISRMFSDEVASTRTIQMVAEALEISDPTEQLSDPDIQLWVYAGIRMREKDQLRFTRFLTSFMAFIETSDAMDGLEDPPTRKR